jgi:molybdopterin-guanine dinucleotide biosynthesis protein A/molybdopterin converting factor small subunit
MMNPASGNRHESTGGTQKPLRIAYQFGISGAGAPRQQQWGEMKPSQQPSTANATAVVLAGGKSSRMGAPKALLDFDGEPLIFHIVRALNDLFSETVVVAAPEQDLPALPARLVRDEVAYQGPVGGIYYGLRTAGGEFVFVTSCDVPFLNSRLIVYLMAQMTGYDVAVPYWENRFQPLHAVYRKSVLPLVKAQLERGELRPIYLFEKVRTRKIEPPELAALDPEGLSFLNMNTPEDYRTALKRWERMRQPGETETGLSNASISTPASISSVPASNSPLTCTVELFGTARLIAKTRSISLVLSQGATLKDVFSSLAERLPILEGRVVDRQNKTLAGGYACNINGLAFVRDDAIKIGSGDRILILAADAGG